MNHGSRRGSVFREGPGLSQSNKVKQKKFREEPEGKGNSTCGQQSIPKSSREGSQFRTERGKKLKGKNRDVQRPGDQTGNVGSDQGIPIFLWW